MKIKELWKKYYPGIVIAVISYIVIEIGKWIFTIFPSLGNGLIGALNSLPYRQAATAGNNDVVSILLSIVLGGVTGVIVLPFLQTLKSLKHLKTVEKMLCEGSLQKTTVARSTSVKSEETEKESYSEELLKIKTSLKPALLSSGILIIFSLLLYVFLFLSIIKPTHLRDQFDRNILLITPYTQISEIDYLKSEWVQMSNEDDYNIIYKRIDEIVIQNSLTKQ